jgi:hypothetical protein
MEMIPQSVADMAELGLFLWGTLHDEKPVEMRISLD